MDPSNAALGKCNAHFDHNTKLTFTLDREQFDLLETDNFPYLVKNEWMSE